MTSRPESLLQALQTAISARVAGTGVEVTRDDPLAREIPAAGIIALRDGAAEEVERTLGETRITWDHQATAVLVCAGNNSADRAAAVERMAQAVAAAVVADRTFGGLAVWADTAPPDGDSTAVEGAADLRLAEMPITLIYETGSNPMEDV